MSNTVYLLELILFLSLVSSTASFAIFPSIGNSVGKSNRGGALLNWGLGSRILDQSKIVPSRRPTSELAMSDGDLPSIEELDAALKVAIEASKAAGDIIVGNAGGIEVEKTKANSRDLLTIIDPLCEKVRICQLKRLQQIVLTKFPSHAFLGEEDVPPAKEASAEALDAILAKSPDWLWIVNLKISRIICPDSYY